MMMMVVVRPLVASDVAMPTRTKTVGRVEDKSDRYGRPIGSLVRGIQGGG